MAIRTTVDIPDPLHDLLRRRAEATGGSIRALIIQAVELTYAPVVSQCQVTGPLIRGKAELGPRFPVDENPHDLILP
jgi:hypothetical protein